MNFPVDPIPFLAAIDLFPKAVQFANKYETIILHDFACSKLYYEEKPIKLLSSEGEKCRGANSIHSLRILIWLDVELDMWQKIPLSLKH